MQNYSADIIARFWAKVDKRSASECWPWLGAKHSKRSEYGWFHVAKAPKRKKIGAHRLAWELANGAIPKGLQVCHHCDNPPCVNPAHLFLGTAKDNIQDCLRKQRFMFQREPEKYVEFGRKHKPAMGLANGKCKLSDAQVAEIRSRYKPYQTTATALAAEYSVAEATIREIIAYRRRAQKEHASL